MRLLSAILLIYILVLSILPCSDSNINSLEKDYIECDHHLSLQSQNFDHKEPHDHTKDTCSPFCTCSCCGISLNVSHSVFTEAEKVFETNITPPITEQEFKLVANVLKAIWQPPKV